MHEQLAIIAGQHPNVRRARKSIATFKLREGMPVGVSVTLRRARMEFLDRLTSIVVPRIRDFRGLNPRTFDGRGNYSMGVNEQLIFPEIDYDSVDTVRGLDVTITTSAKTDQEAFELLLAAGHAVRAGGPSGRPSAKRKKPPRKRSRKRGGPPQGRARAGRPRRSFSGEPRGVRQPETEERGRPRSDERGREAGESAAEESSESMAKTSQKVRQGCKPKFKSPRIQPLPRCGRPRAYYRKFGLCRICLREAAHEGYVPGMTKSSR